MWKSFAVVALGATLSNPALAAEKHIRKSEVPKAVLQAAANKYPKAKMVGFTQEEEHGKTVFEVQMKEAGRRIEIEVSPEGTILIEEKAISMGDLPAAVRQGLSAWRHSNTKVLRIEKVTAADAPETPTYEILVRNEGRYELVFSATGQLTHEEALDDKEED